MQQSFSEKEMLHIHKNMQIFYKTTGISCSLIDENGHQIEQVGESSNYCNRVNSLLAERSPCENSHLYASKQSEELGEAYIFFCPAGLVHMTVAISVGKVFRGAILSGPILMSDPDIYEVDHFLKDYKIQINEKGILSTYYKSTTIISPETVRYFLGLLTILAKDIVIDERDQLQKKRAFYDEQRALHESIYTIKDDDEISDTESYPIYTEKELIAKIIRGDEKGAKAQLNEILGYILFKHGGDTDQTIAMIIELLAVMGRGAIEGGARYEDVFRLTKPTYEKAYSSKDVEEICLWLMETLEQFIGLVFPMKSENTEQVGVIKKAINFINNNYNKLISLEDVANHVSLSPTYFSRLFSQEMNLKYIEYLNMIRVEHSKVYLTDTNDSLSDIAAAMGFSDQSYFSKVFKKYEGITPGKYRKLFY